MAGLVAIAVATTLLSGGGGAKHDLKLSIGDNRGKCDDYTSSYVVGTRVTVKNSDGKILATQTVSGTGTSGTADDYPTCFWTLQFSQLEDSAAYTLTVERPEGKFDSAPNPAQDLTYSSDELAQQDWHLVLGSNF